MTKILLGQLGSNGDCLYATTIARQIKHDFPDCHLTWAISSICKGVIANNPDVDEVWEVPLSGWDALNQTWEAVEQEAYQMVARGTFDHAFMTQICPSHFANYDGTVRPSLFRNYPNPITVPIETVIQLTAKERERVEEWAWTNDVDAATHVVIFECSSKSGQSFMTPQMALETANKVLKNVPECTFVLSTHEPIETGHPQILHGGSLSMRETAELTHFADLFVGCGSGLTVVATSNAAKQNLPNIQVLKNETSVYASFKHDFEYFNKSTNHFLETTTADTDRLASMITTTLRDGFTAARKAYSEDIPVTFTWYFELIETMLLQKRRYVDAARSLLVTADRYGWSHALSQFGLSRIAPFVELDETAQFPDQRAFIKTFHSRLAAAQETPTQPRYNTQP